MHIAVNTRMLIPGKMEGIGHFTCESMKRMTHDHPEHQFTFIFDRPYDPSFIFSDNIKPVIVFPPARHPILWYLWHECSLPAVFRKIKPDIFIGTDGFLTLSSEIKSISVIHDINFEHFPKDLPFFNRKFYRHFFPIYAKHANRIAAVSEFTKNDVTQSYNIPASKIDVVYNGAGENFKPVNEDIKIITRQRITNGSPYLLFVGALHQRKNIANLLRAYDAFREKISSNLKLVLVGQRKWWTNEMEEVYDVMKYKNDVVFTGRVSAEHLAYITASAFAMTYVSTFEGFGIPIVEAMRCDIPVITSNVTSMPEIAGDAALLCDPFSVTSIRDALIKINADEKLREILIEKGRTRSENFTWQKTADALWKCIEKTLE